MDKPVWSDAPVLMSVTINPGAEAFAVDQKFTIESAISFFGFLEHMCPEQFVRDDEDDPSFDWSSRSYTGRVYPNLVRLYRAARNLGDEAASKNLASSYQNYSGWRSRHLKLLDGENSVRKQYLATWNAKREQLVTLLAALGATGAVAVRLGETHREEIVAVLAMPRNCVDVFVQTLQAFSCPGEHKLHSVEQGELRDWSDRGDFSLSIVSRFGAMPLAEGGEAIAIAIDRLKIDETRFHKITNAWKRANGSLSAFRATARRFLPTERIEFAIEGLLPRKMVSVLVGPSGIGKSTLALQMGACVALGVPFCDIPTATSDREQYVVYLSGEDSVAVIDARLFGLEAGLGLQAHNFIPLCEGYEHIEAALAAAGQFDVALLIVDTVAAFCPQVNDTAAMRNLANALHKFAVEKDCAVLAIHHTNKGKAVGSAKAVFDAMKGSSELPYAARNVVAFFEDGKQRVLAIAKTNMPASQKLLRRPLRLTYMPDTEMHAPMQPPALMTAAESDGAEPERKIADTALARSEKADALADARIVAAIVNRQTGAGARITRSGEREPYNLKASELAGWPRGRVRAAHTAAAESGLLDA